MLVGFGSVARRILFGRRVWSSCQNFVPFRIGVGVAIGIGIETVSSNPDSDPDPDITEAESAINESHFQDVTCRNIFMTTAIMVYL